MQILTITISFVALLLSGISIFFQFFHRPRRLRIITLPLSKDHRTRFGICNAGKESVFITGLTVNYSIKYLEGSKEFPFVDVRGEASIVSPGNIMEFSYDTKDPPENFLKYAPESVNIDGKPERTVNIVVYIQFAFPNGKVFSNWFKSGSCTVSENSSSYSVYGMNLNLLKSALPVLDKRAK